MNFYHYSVGNPFKIKFRRHFCFNCMTELTIENREVVVSQKDEKAKYYDFSTPLGGDFIGSTKFIHKIFYCSRCQEQIEFVTQLSLEDVDIVIHKVIKYFKKRGRTIVIAKTYEMKNGERSNKISDYSKVSNLCLIIKEHGKNQKEYKIPIKRENEWERAYYFALNKKELINLLKNN